MASEDFVIDIGLNLNDKEIRSQLQELRSSVIKPFQADFAKTINRPFNMAQRTKLVSRGISAAEKVYNIHSGAITPFEAVRMTLKGSQKTGTPQREMQDEMVAGLKTRIKRNNIIREQEVKSIRTHLKEMGGYTTPLESIQQQIRQETFDKTQQQVNELVEAKNAEERRLAIEEHQKKILEIIAKNTGVFKKWNQIDKALVQREQRSILRSLQPGEDLTEYQSKVMGVNFGGANIRKTAAIATTVVAALAESVKSVWQEATREKGMLSKISSMTGYSAQAERALQYAGVQNAYQSMASLSSFNDRLRLGQVSAEQMQGFAMFGRHTFAQLRRDQNDIRALHAAFAADMANAEARGWTRQTAAQAMGMSDLLPTLGFTPEEMEEFFRLAESAKYEQARAKPAYMTDLTSKTAIDSIKDLMSKNKTGALVGTGVGSAVGLAAGAKLGGLAGTKIGASVGAMFGGVGAAPGAAIGGLIGAGAGLLAGAFGAGKVGGVIGAGVQELSSPDSAGVRMNNTVNVHIDRDAMNEILNSGSSTQTFATTATAEPW